MPTENNDPRISPRAGQLPAPEQLVDIGKLLDAYYTLAPDPAVAAQRVAFGTSGHRGSSFARSFNEAHVLAISQATCRWRRQAGTDGPLFIGDGDRPDGVFPMTGVRDRVLEGLGLA